MNFYIYKITNKVNGNFYIGKRQCECKIEDDWYFGSGIAIKNAIKKYGMNNLEKTILHICNSIIDLNNLEKEIINEQLINNSKCYNIARGGHGGYTFYENRTFHHTDESKKKISNANKGKKRPDLSERNKTFNYWKQGNKRTEEDKAKKSIAALNRLQKQTTDFNNISVCPFCKKAGQSANMKRWHFENCKSLLKSAS